MCSHRGMTRASKSGQAGGEGSGRGTPDPAPCSKLRPHGAPPVERFAPTHREGLKTFPLSHRDRGLPVGKRRLSYIHVVGLVVY